MRVVIIGGGFGGIRAALNLANKPGFEVSLISKLPYFEYTAALYRFATGRSQNEAAIPLDDFFVNDRNIKLIQDEIVDIDNDARVVTGRSGEPYHYDALIFAIGSVVNYFGIAGLSELSYSVRTVNDALALKKHLHDDLVAGHATERNYVVVGGGATGVELAGEFTSYLKKVRRQHGIKTKFNVDLIEASPGLLSSLPTSFTDRINRRLKRLGVKMYFNTAVKAEDAAAIQLPRGSIKSHTVVWSAGLTNNPFFDKYPNLFTTGKGDKVAVNEYLEALPGIYIVGDSAATQYSGLAQTAISDANFVTSNLKRQLRHQTKVAYQPKHPIYAIPAGHRWAAVLWGKMRFYGYSGWALRRLADLRLYITFLPIKKALTIWRSGSETDEVCATCQQ